MQLSEVKIGPFKLYDDKVRVSHKTRLCAEKYLKEHDLTLSELNEDQQQCVFKYAKNRRVLKWWVMAGVFSSLILLVCVFWGYNIFSESITEFEPTSLKVVFEEGSEKYVDIAKDDREYIQNYGKFCMIASAVVVCTAYAVVFGIVNLIASIFNIRHERKIFRAFLPAVRDSVKK